jgi:hypothetical protein
VTAEHDRIRELARAEVAENSPAPAGNQIALVAALLGPATAEAAAKRRAQQDSGQDDAA